MQRIRKCNRNRDWSSENEKHSIGRFHSRNIGPKGYDFSSLGLRGSEISLLINTLHVQLITFGRVFFLRFLRERYEARKGGCVRAKSQDATDGRIISEQNKSETMINIRRTEDTSSVNARFSSR